MFLVHRSSMLLLVFAISLGLSGQSRPSLTSPTQQAPGPYGTIQIEGIDLLRIQPDAGISDFGLFCKWELGLRKRVGIPIIIRLHDVRHAEAMDGKSVPWTVGP